MNIKTNIKNLPDGEYLTERGYSQRYPWVVISKTAKTMTIAEVLVDPDPEWKEKMEFHAGGFCGHCANQSEQTWLYAGVNLERTRTVRLVKSRFAGEDKCWGDKGTLFSDKYCTYFYDYNF